MSNRQFDTRTETKSSLSRQPVRRREQGRVSETSIFPNRDPLLRAISSSGNLLSASTHAAMLKCATAGRPSRAGQSLLQLQRQYGNRYVQRVLDLARKGAGDTEVAPDVEQAIQRTRGGGQALDSGARTQMESAFGADFSGVRVHTDGKADTLNRQLSARAFTTGQDIFFRQGAYNPGSSSGRELLAHELTHVVQQNSGKVQNKLNIGQPGDIYEQEADQMAQAVMQREHQVTLKRKEKGLINRKTEEEEKEEPIQAKIKDALISRQMDVEEEEKKLIQANSRDERVQSFMQKESIQRKEDTIRRLQSTITGTLIKIQCNNNDEEESEPVAGTAEAIRSEGRSGGIIDPWAPRRVRWRIGYNEVFVTTRGRGARGSRMPRGTRRQRAPWDILSIQSLVMTPQRGDNVVFSGSNPLQSGSAILGPENHPVDVGGRAHGVIHYTREQRVRVDAMTNNVSQAHENQLELWMARRTRQLLEEGRMQSEADLEETLTREGVQRLEVIQRQLRRRNPGTLDRVNVRFQTRGEGHTLPPVRYPTISSDKTINADIDITAERVETRLEATTSRRERRGAEVETSRRQRYFVEIEDRRTFSQTVAQHFRNATITAFRRATEQVDRQVNRTATSISGRLRGQGRSNLDLSTNLSTGLSASANLGSILRGLGLLVRHPLARIVLSILGRSLNIPIRVNIDTRSRAQAGLDLLADAIIQGSWSRDELNEALRRIRTEVTWANEIVHEINSVVTRSIMQRRLSQLEVETSVRQRAEAGEERGTTVTRTDIPVYFRDPRPQLRITEIEEGV